MRVSYFVYQSKIVGNYAFVATGATGLSVLNISNPTAPIETSFLLLPGGAYNIAINGFYAYVTGTDSSLRVINIANPALPILVGTLFGVHASQIDIAGNYVYTVQGNSGLNVIDVSNPVFPVLVGHLNVASTRNIRVRGDYAYIPNTSGLCVVDIDTPSTPRIVSQLLIPQRTGPWDVALQGDFAYLAADSVMLCVNVSNPQIPAIVSQFPTPVYGWRIAADDSFAYVAAGGYGVYKIDIRNPATPNLAAHYTDSPAWGITVSGNHLYVSSEDYGFNIVSNTANPTRLSTISSHGGASQIAISGNYAYIPANYGLRVIDMNQRQNPHQVGYWESTGPSQAVTVRNNFAYLACGRNCLSIIDVTNPSIPRFIGNCDTTGSGSDIVVSGNYAYEVGGILRVIDISTPTTPTIVSNYSFSPLSATRLTMSGNYLYITARSLNLSTAVLKVLDISNPLLPLSVGSVTVYSTPYSGITYDIALQGTFAYVATDTGGLKIVNVSNPTSPVVVGTYHTRGKAHSVSTSGHFAYVTTADNTHSGLYVLDITNPTSPIECGYFETGRRTSYLADVVAEGNYAYMVDFDFFTVYDCSRALSVWNYPQYSLPLSSRIVTAYPNPFNSTTILHYKLPVTSPVSFEVFNANGQRVTTSILGNQTAGSHDWQWKANTLPSGIYYVQLHAGNSFQMQQRVVLVK